MPQRKSLPAARVLWLLIAAALAIRIAAALARPPIGPDEVVYVRMAETLAAGEGLPDGDSPANLPPLLPLFTAGIAAVVRNYIVAAYIVVTVFGSLTLLPVYLLGKELAGKREGLMAAALVAVTPLFVDLSSRIYSDSVFGFFLVLGIVFGRHMLRGCRIPCGTLSGAALGMAYLAHPSALYYAVILVALAVIVALDRGIWRQMAKALAFFALFFLLYLAPYMLYLRAELGRWTLSGGTSLPGAIAWQVSGPFGGLFNLEFPFWLWLLLGLGLFSSAWTRSRAAAVGYLLVMMAPALILMTFYVDIRFFMPAALLMMIWVAQGWARLEGWAGETVSISFPQEIRPRLERWVPWVVGAAVLAPLLVAAAAAVRGNPLQILL